MTNLRRVRSAPGLPATSQIATELVEWSKQMRMIGVCFGAISLASCASALAQSTAVACLAEEIRRVPGILGASVSDAGGEPGSDAIEFWYSHAGNTIYDRLYVYPEERGTVRRIVFTLSDKDESPLGWDHYSSMGYKCKAVPRIIFP